MYNLNNKLLLQRQENSIYIHLNLLCFQNPPISKEESPAVKIKGKLCKNTEPFVTFTDLDVKQEAQHWTES